jgi:hypothetical protein
LRLWRKLLTTSIVGTRIIARFLQELAAWNSRYEAKFGHIFIICASGKSAKEMLDAVKGRCEVATSPLFHCALERSTEPPSFWQQLRPVQERLQALVRVPSTCPLGTVVKSIGDCFHECPPANSLTSKLCLEPFDRYDTEPYAELRVAAAEQMKITELRLVKLIESTRGAGRGPAGPPLGAGGVDAHPTAGDTASAAGTPSGREGAVSAVGPAEEPVGAAARRAGRLRAHFVQPGGPGLVASPTAASPGVLLHRVRLWG